MDDKYYGYKQVWLHELSPGMFDEVAPTSQLYENKEADTQTTRCVAKELNDDNFTDAISGRGEQKKSDETEDDNNDGLKQSDEKQFPKSSFDLIIISINRERGREERGKP